MEESDESIDLPGSAGLIDDIGRALGWTLTDRATPRCTTAWITSISTSTAPVQSLRTRKQVSSNGTGVGMRVELEVEKDWDILVG